MQANGPERRRSLTRRPRCRTLQQATPAYVWQGHRTDTKSSAFDGLNRDAAIAVLTSGYDKNGNLTNSGTHTWSYDAGNRLTLVGNGTTSMGVAWDPLGRLRATQTSAGLWTYFLYAGDQMVGEYALNTDGAPALRRYVHGPGVDEPLVWYEGAGVADRRWLHADRQGSIIGVSNGAGAVTPYNYGPWGEPNDWTGPRFRYTGQATFPEAQAYHYKARVYDPAMGRFLQTDPIGQADDMNLYAYVRGDPVNGTDPTGRFIYFSSRQVTPAITVPTPFGVVHVPAQYHLFLVTHALYVGDPKAKIFSWGPTPGAQGDRNSSDAKRLVQQFAGTELNSADRKVWASEESSKAGRTVQLDATDDAAERSANNVVGGKDYDAVPTDGVNSNAAAFRAGRDADRISGSRPASAGTPAPALSAPGIGQADKVQTRCLETGSRVSRAC